MLPRALLAAVAVACLAPSAALAQNSFAVYFDPSKSVTITGKVTAFRFTNPHGMVALELTDASDRGIEWRAGTNGRRLLATQWFEDPQVLDNNGARFIEWAKHDGQYVYPYECDPSFAVEYQAAGASGAGK